MRKGPEQQERPTVYYYADQPGARLDRIIGERFRVPAAAQLEKVELDANVVSTSYFETMGYSLVAGQGLTAEPVGAGCRVAVVNEEAADLYFGGKAPGAAVIDDRGRRTEVVGVIHTPALGTFARRVEPAIYFPMTQDWLPYMTLLLTSHDVSRPMLAKLQATVTAVPGRGPAPVSVKTFETHLSQTALAPLRIATIILGASATTGLLLSILGLFGALSDAAQQRSRELAIRIAFGARRRHVIGQVLGEGGRLAAAGASAGLLGSILISRWLVPLTRSAAWPALWVWLAGPLVLAAAVAIASVLPARTASMVNPLTILRNDR